MTKEDAIDSSISDETETTPHDVTGAITKVDGRHWIWRIELTRDVVDMAEFARNTSDKPIVCPECGTKISSRTAFTAPNRVA